MDSSIFKNVMKEVFDAKHSTEIVEIFSEYKLAGQAPSSSVVDASPIKINTHVKGFYLPEHRVLILKTELAHSHYAPPNLDDIFPNKTSVFCTTLSEAARFCIKIADQYYFDVQKYLTDNYTSKTEIKTDSPKNSGPYRK